MSVDAHTAVSESPAPRAVSKTYVNRLLNALPQDECRRVSPYLRQMGLHARQMLAQSGEPIRDIVFPSGGVCSAVKTTDDGHTIELLGIGREGAVGVSVAWGQAEALADVVVQIPERGALSLPLDVFTSEMERGGALAVAISDYLRTWTLQLMQASACNALHSADQRCCRWLLTTGDRVQADRFPVTQELLATALGVRRPTVTLVMSDLHRDGLVTYGRGQMTIVNRAALLERACECYASLSPGRD
jgi:CRP-like cAMP-binding protein